MHGIFDSFAIFDGKLLLPKNFVAIHLACKKKNMILTFPLLLVPDFGQEMYWVIQKGDLTESVVEK